MRCISVLGWRSISLPHRFLGAASGFVLEFTLRWPLLMPGRKRSLTANLQPASLEAPQTPWHTLEAGKCVVDQLPGWRASRVRVHLPAMLAGARGTARVEIREGTGARRLLGTIDFEVLDAASAERLRRETLAVQTQQLWIHCGTRRYPGRFAADTSDFLVPEFSLPDIELNGFVPDSETVVTLSLAHGGSRIHLSCTPMTLAAGALAFTGPPVHLKDTRLFPGSGDYCLVASLADRDIASFPFRIVDEREWLQQIKVSRLSIDAETRAGRIVRGVRTLRWKEHRAFEPSFQIDSPIPAPNSLAYCTVRILNGATLLQCHEFALRFDESTLTVKLPTVTLDTPPLPSSRKPLRLTIAIYLGGELKCLSPIIILPAGRITNFEGQLNLEVKSLPLDEAEYEQIIRSLGVTPPPVTNQRFFNRRFFWRKAAWSG